MIGFTSFTVHHLYMYSGSIHCMHIFVLLEKLTYGIRDCSFKKKNVLLSTIAIVINTMWHFSESIYALPAGLAIIICIKRMGLILIGITRRNSWHFHGYLSSLIYIQLVSIYRILLV